MREPVRDINRLKHILQAIDNIKNYTQGITSAEELDNDPLRKHATTYNVQIIGEAIYKLTFEFKNNHPETPWRMIEKSRHILVHDYYQVEMNILWSIITEDLDPLREQVTSYIQELE